ncbi:uncharacterized protein AMSG_12141 [Thecamonas trahens ATCC 50062]|uniref:Uncharacterized protein n=1 Tax=Thecamonas trahens ATCC 50062 TaxID=461836 RepID=A0A0L0DHU7_THETB|nr:hypothetical protein AMSG_12141 [Thecamonas trahens ATCC 50062]KNC51939.1 hypothetical protein AMSG_12141 [Thecamonas trahens ATCC 50062]|eukprot:XP_013755626.1 hypothetical protein AMSG_12141 [Thecamonas trahens ATCC 50062]
MASNTSSPHQSFGLQELPTEVVHLIAFHSNVLESGDVVALATTCRSLHRALLGSEYGRGLAMALAGWDVSVEARNWRAACHVVRRLDEDDRAGFWADGERMMEVFDGGCATDPAWHALVAAMAASGAACEIGWDDAFGQVVWEGCQRMVGVGAMAAAYGNEELAMELAPRLDADERALMVAIGAQMGMLALVEWLLDDEAVDASLENNYALRAATRTNCEPMLRLLLAHPSTDPAADNNTAIRWAAGHGLTRMVELLLADVRVDPTAYNDFAIRVAAGNGHCAVVDLLLADTRIDPSADNNEALIAAAFRGHTDVVASLLAHPRVDPSSANSHALQIASKYGHLDVVMLLLADERVDPAADSNEALVAAAHRGHAAVVRALLADPRVDPSANDNHAIATASGCGHLAVVELLLADDRVDPSAYSHYALRWAARGGHLAVVTRLVAHSRIGLDPHAAATIIAATRAGDTAVVERLTTPNTAADLPTALSLVRDNDRLVAEVNEARDEVRRLEVDNDQLGASVAALSAQLVDIQKNHAQSASVASTTFSADIYDLQAALEDARALNADLARQVEETRATSTTQLMAFKETEARVDELLVELDEVSTARRELLLRVSRDNAALADAQAEALEARDALARERAGHADLLAALQSRVSALEAELASLRVDNDGLAAASGADGAPQSEAVLELRARLQASQHETRELLGRLAELDAETAAVRAAHHEYVTEARSLRARHVNAASAAEVYQRELAATLAEAMALTSELSAAQARIESLRGRLAAAPNGSDALRVALDSAVAERNEAYARATAFEADIAALRSQVADMEASAVRASVTLAAARAEETAAKAERADATAAAATLQQQLKAAEAELDDARARAGDLPARRSRYRGSSDGDSLAAKEDQVASMRAESAAADSTAAAVADKLRAERARVRALEEDVAKRESAAVLLTQKLRNAEEEIAGYARIVARYEAETDELAAKVSALSDANTHYAADAAARSSTSGVLASGTAIELQQQLVAESARSLALQDRVLELTAERDALVRQVQAEAATRASAHDEIAQLEASLEARAALFAQLHEAHDEVVAAVRVEELRNESMDLSSRLASMDADLSAMEAEAAEGGDRDRREALLRLEMRTIELEQELLLTRTRAEERLAAYEARVRASAEALASLQSGVGHPVQAAIYEREIEALKSERAALLAQAQVDTTRRADYEARIAALVALQDPAALSVGSLPTASALTNEQIEALSEDRLRAELKAMRNDNIELRRRVEALLESSRVTIASLKERVEGAARDAEDTRRVEELEDENNELREQVRMIHASVEMRISFLMMQIETLTEENEKLQVALGATPSPSASHASQPASSSARKSAASAELSPPRRPPQASPSDQHWDALVQELHEANAELRDEVRKLEADSAATVTALEERVAELQAEREALLNGGSSGGSNSPHVTPLTAKVAALQSRNTQLEERVAALASADDVAQQRDQLEVQLAALRQRYIYVVERNQELEASAAASENGPRAASGAPDARAQALLARSDRTLEAGRAIESRADKALGKLVETNGASPEAINELVACSVKRSELAAAQAALQRELAETAAAASGEAVVARARAREAEMEAREAAAREAAVAKQAELTAAELVRAEEVAAAGRRQVAVYESSGTLDEKLVAQAQATRAAEAEADTHFASATEAQRRCIEVQAELASREAELHAALNERNHALSEAHRQVQDALASKAELHAELAASRQREEALTSRVEPVVSDAGKALAHAELIQAENTRLSYQLAKEVEQREALEEQIGEMQGVIADRLRGLESQLMGEAGSDPAADAARPHDELVALVGQLRAHNEALLAERAALEEQIRAHNDVMSASASFLRSENVSIVEQARQLQEQRALLRDGLAGLDDANAILSGGSEDELRTVLKSLVSERTQLVLQTDATFDLLRRTLGVFRESATVIRSLQGKNRKLKAKVKTKAARGAQ